MDNNLEGQVNEVVEEQLAPAMPAEEQQPTEATGELPEATSDRTRIEFEKLKAHNREMADKLSKYESTQYGNNVFENLYGQKAQPQTIAPAYGNVESEAMPNFVDENGYVDPEALKRSLYEANSRAQRAEQAAQSAQAMAKQQEERRQVKEAHDKFPWLDPSNRDQFDPTSYELVRDRLVRNMWEGREQSLTDVAQEVSRFHTPSVKSEELKEQAVQEYKEKQVTRSQASSVQTGRGQPREETVRLDDLRDRTLRGDQSALDERLRNI